MADVLGTDDPARMRAIMARIEARDAARTRAANALRRAAHDLRCDAGDVAERLVEADPDELGAEADRLEAERPALMSALEEAAGDLREAERALAAVGGDDAAARLASERRRLAMEIAEGSRRALALRFGVRIASEAIHRYRDRHRSAMMKEASKAFASISCGAFSGLVTLPGLDEEHLAARRPDGQRVPVRGEPKRGRGGGKGGGKGGGARGRDGGLSKGTSNQLYLALRIAGYHEFAAKRTPPPFMCDDVLETFDDGRTAATLRLLGEMAGRGQVIVLTHHEHVLDIARDAVPGVTLHRLDGPAATASAAAPALHAVAAE